MIKAITATVKIAEYEFEGLMNESGEFGIAVPQLSKLFNIPIKHAPHHLREFFRVKIEELEAKISIPRKTTKDTSNLDQIRLSQSQEGFQKWKTPLHSGAVNVLTLPQFEFLVKNLAKTQKTGRNKSLHSAIEIAGDWVDALFGVGLWEMFCDAFHREVTAQDRQAQLLERIKGKAVRRTLTDAIQDYILARPELSETYKTWIYSNVSVEVCKAIYGCKPSALAKHREIDPKKLRDSMSAKELQLVQDVERLTMRLIDEDLLEPMIAVKEAIGRLSIKRQPV